MRFKRISGLALGLALAAAAVLPTAAGAETVTSPLSAGLLSLTSAPIAFGSVAVTGADQTIDSIPGSAWGVGDARGTGAAWTGTISATDLTSAAGSVETVARTIPVGALSVTAGAATAGTNSDPTTNISGATGMALTASAQTLIASTGASKGSYTFVPSYSLVIPAAAFRSNYTAAVGSTALIPYVSTLTLTIS
jgi:hypothetical protein